MKKSFMKGILEASKRLNESKRYIMEDFLGIFPVGSLFKKYQNNFIDTFVGAINSNYCLLTSDVQSKVAPELIKLSFREGDNQELVIDYVFTANELIGGEGKLSICACVKNDEVNLMFNNTLTNDLSSGAEIDKLITSYNDTNFSFEDIGKLVDAINQFSVSLAYLYGDYLNKKASNGEKASTYNNESINNFLKYLEEELKRDVFNNAIANKYVNLNIDTTKYAISIHVKTFDRLNYLVADYVFSPETNKFKLVQLASSNKKCALSKVNSLSIENVMDFVNALKEDVTTIFNKSLTEARFKTKVANFVFDLNKYQEGVEFGKDSNEYKYLETLEEMPEGLEYKQESDKYVVAKLNKSGLTGNKQPMATRITSYKREDIKKVPRGLYGDQVVPSTEVETEDTTGPGDVAGVVIPADLGLVEPVKTSYGESDMVAGNENMITSEPVESNPEVNTAVVGDPNEIIDLPESAAVKEVVFLGENPEEVQSLISEIKTGGCQSVVDKILAGYDATSSDITVATDYIKDLNIESTDKIVTCGDYTVVYDETKNILAILKDIKRTKLEMRRRKLESMRKRSLSRYRKEGLSDNMPGPTSTNAGFASTNLKNVGASVNRVNSIPNQPLTQPKQATTTDLGPEVAAATEVETPEELVTTEADKEVIYVAKSPEEANSLIAMVEAGNCQEAIDTVMGAYEMGGDEITTTDNYIQDLQIDPTDTVTTCGDYTIVYNVEGGMFALLQNDISVEGIEATMEHFKKQARKAKMESRRGGRYRKEDKDEDDEDVMAGNENLVGGEVTGENNEPVDAPDVDDEIADQDEDGEEDEEFNMEGKEVIYIAPDADSAKEILDIINTPEEDLEEDEEGNKVSGVEMAINAILDEYNEENEDVTTTDNYLEDLEIDSNDKIVNFDEYILVYDDTEDEEEVILLRDLEHEDLEDEEAEESGEIEDENEAEEKEGEEIETEEEPEKEVDEKNKTKELKGPGLRKDEISGKDFSDLTKLRYGVKTSKADVSFGGVLGVPNLMEKAIKYFGKRNIKLEGRKIEVMTSGRFARAKQESKSSRIFTNVKLENKKYKVGLFGKDKVGITTTIK